MVIKLCAPFSSLRLRLRISTVYPSMIFLSVSRSSSSSMGDIIGGMKLRSRSEDNLIKLGDCVYNMDDDVSKLFMEFHQTDLREDPELFRLLNYYFTTSKRVSELCESLRNCLEKAEHYECLLIDEALRDFHNEKLGYDGLLEASFGKTFRDLRNFNDFYTKSGDTHLDSDFLSGNYLDKFQICHDELAKMIATLEKTMKKIDKKLKRVRGTRMIIVAALLAPLIAIIFVSKIIAGVFGLVPVVICS